MNQDLLFSFVIPIYNVSGFIESCVASVLKQTFGQYEIILVDDGSEDDSGVICDRLASENSCIKVVHKENGGLSSARNAGVLAASGEYVFFLDADDTISGSLLSDIIQIENFKIYDVIVGQVEMIENSKQCSESSVPLTYCKYSKDETLELYTKEQISGYAVCKFIRRLMILEHNIKFPVGHNYEDIHTVYKFLMYAENVAVLNKVYYYYLISNQSSITNNDSIKNLKDYFDSVEIMYHDLKQRKGLQNLRCLRINHLIQVYIRLFYYSKKDAKAIPLLKKVSNIIDSENVPVMQLRGYCHFQKYLFYKFGVLKPMLWVRYRLGEY